MSRLLDEEEAPLPDAKRRGDIHVLCHIHSNIIDSSKAIKVNLKVFKPDGCYPCQFEVSVCPNSLCHTCQQAFVEGDVINYTRWREQIKDKWVTQQGFSHFKCADKMDDKWSICFCHGIKRSKCDVVELRISGDETRTIYLCHDARCCSVCKNGFKDLDSVWYKNRKFYHKSCLVSCLNCGNKITDEKHPTLEICKSCMISCTDCGKDITRPADRIPCKDKKWRCQKCGKKEARLWVPCGSLKCQSEHYNVQWGEINHAGTTVDAVMCDKATCDVCDSELSLRRRYCDDPEILYVHGNTYCTYYECRPSSCDDCGKYKELQKHPVDGEYCKKCYVKHLDFGDDSDDSASD